MASVCIATIGLLLGGCSNIPNLRASEVHQTISYPLIFTSQIDAEGIEKETLPDGHVVRKAKTISNTVTVGGYSRTTVLKDAEIDEASQPAPAPAK